MSSKATSKPTTPVASSPSLHPRLTFRDRLRVVLFLAIPIYARLFISPSISSVVSHIYITGTSGISIVHFCGDIVSLAEIWDVIYALVLSSSPGLIKSYRLTAWIVPDIEGWRSGVIHWAFIATSLMFLLPEKYGRDVEALSEEQTLAEQFLSALLSGPIAWYCFGQGEYSRYIILVVWRVLASFVERVYLISCTYICLCRSGKTVREVSWLYKHDYKNTWPFTNGYGKELTFKEVLQWHATSNIKPRA